MLVDVYKSSPRHTRYVSLFLGIQGSAAKEAESHSGHAGLQLCQKHRRSRGSLSTAAGEHQEDTDGAESEVQLPTFLPGLF